MGKKVYFVVFGVIVFIVILVVAFSGKSVSSFEAINNFEGDIAIYKSMSCGCCGVYADYFKSKGNSEVEVLNVNNPTDVKERYNIPSAMGSCHTTIVGDY